MATCSPHPTVAIKALEVLGRFGAVEGASINGNTIIGKQEAPLPRPTSFLPVWDGEGYDEPDLD